MKNTSTTTPNTWVIIPAAGSGKRFGGAVPKQFIDLGGQTLLTMTITRLSQCDDIHGLVVVLPPGQSDCLQEIDTDKSGKTILVADGGLKRMDSVRNGFNILPGQCKLALIHDGVRPNVSPDLVSRVVASAWLDGASVPAVTPTDTVKQVDHTGTVVNTLDRNRLRLIQTPQGFRREVLEKAYQWLDHTGAHEDFSDEAGLVEASGGKVTTVMGDPKNIKVTTLADLSKLPSTAPRVGHGYDVHRLTKNRKLVLCGVEIDHHLGLMGHSDADVALHALIDAILGAAGCGDIGAHFPDTDPAYKGSSSLDLLNKVVEIISHAGYRVSSADITIVAQSPRLSEFIPKMRKTVAEPLAILPEYINVKATTEEGLGFTGTDQGIASHAIAVLVYRHPDPWENRIGELVQIRTGE